MTFFPIRVAILTAACIALLTLYSADLSAQDRAIENLRVSKTGNTASAEVVIACPVGLLGNSLLSESGEMQIRLTLHPSCAQIIGRQSRDEIYRRPSGELARIRELSFLTEDGQEATLTVQFDSITAVTVTQGTQRDTITLHVDAGNIVASLPEPERDLPSQSTSDLTVEPVTEIESFLEQRRAEDRPQALSRTPIRLVGPGAPGGPERYVVQLDSGPAVRRVTLSAEAQIDNLRMYINDRAIGDRRWQELRIGFFESESDARNFLALVTGEFPDALIAVADELEQESAGTEALVAEKSDQSVVARPSTNPVGMAEADGVFAEGRQALMMGNHARSIELFNALLALPEYSQRHTVLEMLGVAHERSGDLVAARSSYRAYLAEYIDGPDAQRVNQRLAGLITTIDASRESFAAGSNAQDGLWDVRGGVSQYYRDDRYRLVESDPERTTQSALLSHLDLNVRRNGDRFDFQSRVNAVYIYDLLDERQGSGEQALVSRAYLGVVDKQEDWSVRLGRQSLYRSGILGRFDGAHGSYRLKPKVVLNFTAGNPVDSPHSEYSSRRDFVGFSADLDQFIGNWDISVFSLLQSVDGIADRQAIGGEAQYQTDRWNLVAALDMDLSYGVANSALFAANWRATDKLTFNGRVDLHAAPFLATRNAIIGQSVLTVDELLDVYSESQIRRIARDRSAQARSASIGFSWPIFDRFQMNSDVTYTEYDATVASAGIAQVPASDPQLYFSLNFIGSSLFKDGDTAIFEFRHDQTDTGETAGVILDFRIPMGQRLRINPRIAIASRRYWVDWSTELFVEPTLRFLMRIRGQHRLEAEIGGLWSSRGFRSLGGIPGLADEETSARFLNLGYWWEF